MWPRQPGDIESSLEVMSLRRRPSTSRFLPWRWVGCSLTWVVSDRILDAEPHPGKLHGSGLGLVIDPSSSLPALYRAGAIPHKPRVVSGIFRPPVVRPNILGARRRRSALSGTTRIWSYPESQPKPRQNRANEVETIAKIFLI